MTDAEHRDAAWLALTQTTISYPEWVKRRDAGRYPDITKTKWWQAFDELAKIGLVPPPTPNRTPLPPVGPFRTESGDHIYRDGDGLLTEKLHVTSAPAFGILNQRWNGSLPPAQQLPPPSTGTWVLRDCKVQNVSANPPRSLDGRGEAGLQVGERAQGERLEIWNCAWMLMCTLANSAGSRFTDLDLHDNPHVGLYSEHGSVDIEYRRCSFGGPRLGIIPDSSSLNVEWAYQSAVYGPRMGFGGKGYSANQTYVDCDFYCPRYVGVGKPYEVNGAFLDAGTFGFEFIRPRFYGPGDAIGLPKRLLDPSKPNKVIDAVYENQGRREPSFHDNAIG